MEDAQDRLLAAARRALRWFDSHNGGKALNGPSDCILIARSLANAIGEVELDGMGNRADTERAELMARR